MLNNIDKDIRLFIPSKSKFLLFGGNFLFSKRLYEIAKRDLKIKRIDFDNKIENSDRIKGLIKYYNSDTFIFTSEILLKLNKEDFNKLKQLILSIKEIIGIKIIFISISKPLTPFAPYYYTQIQEIKDILDLKQDIFYEFSSFITYVDSNIETNPLELIDDSSKFLSLLKDQVYLADDIINDLVSKINNIGAISFDNNFSSMSFKEICDYAKNQSKCSLNIVYRKKPYEIVNNKSVADRRFELGSNLTSVIPSDVLKDLDLIIPIPETGKYYAQGLSYKTNIPYVEAFYKKSEIGRSFDIKDAEKRKEFINSKLDLIPNLVKNKNIGIVDEAIFTGATLKIVSQLLKTTNVGKVYYFIPTPECKFRCKFNMQPDRELLLEKINKDNLSSYFNIDNIYFQSISTFKNIISPSGYNTCCFSNT
jgi:adenine/guanine phosphoribosyltransferase-like PRPP-binding protein